MVRRWRAFADLEITAVMHFAAASLVGECMTAPQKYYINNVQDALSLLQALRNASCHHIVFSSTGAVYGNSDSKALPGGLSLRADHFSGASKWVIERMLADYRAAYGFGAFCLRYFNASGADPAGGIGLCDNETHLIPRAMMALQGHVELPSSATTTTRPTALRSATTSTSPTLPQCMSRR